MITRISIRAKINQHRAGLDRVIAPPCKQAIPALKKNYFLEIRNINGFKGHLLVGASSHKQFYTKLRDDKSDESGVCRHHT
jgi:hypothetical protein